MSIVLANLLSLFVLIVFIRIRWVQTRSLIEPGIVFAANLIVLYPFRGLILFLYSDVVLPNYPGLFIADNLDQSSWLATLGCVGFVCGYLMILGRRELVIMRGAVRPVPFDGVLICFLFFLASLIGMAYKIETGDYMSYLMPQASVPELQHIGTMLTELQWPAYIGGW